MSSNSPHTAKSVVFSCIDDRIVEADHAFISTLSGGAFHPRIAGGGVAFLDTSDGPSAIKQIVAAYKINGIKDVYLQSHTDCGAYALAGVRFDGPEQELDHLYADLDQAAKIVSQALLAAGTAEGEVTIHTRVINPDGKLLERNRQTASIA